MKKFAFAVWWGILLITPALWAETAVIIDKQNEFNGCTVEVAYTAEDMARERIDWERSLHYFDKDWELRKAIDFYRYEKENRDKTRAKRVILFDPAGREKTVTYYDGRGQVMERIEF